MTDTKEKIGDMSSRALPSDVDWDVIWKRDAGNFLAGGPSTRTRIRLALWMLKKYSKENGSLLDVGCGSGLLLGLAAAKRHYAKIAGVDVASAALDLARASYPSFSFYELDVQKQRMPEMFDTIISLATVDIIEDDKAAMRNMAAMLAPRGHLVISVQHDPAYWNKLDDLRVWRRYSVRDIEDLASTAELRLVYQFSWGWPLYHWYYKMLERHPVGMDQKSKKGFWERTLATIAYRLFFFDDLFTWSGKGRQLFAVFEKP